MNDSKRITSEIMSTAIMCVLFLAMLVLVVFAAKAYKSSVNAQSRNDDSRAVLSYIITAVKGNKTDDIRLDTIDGVQTLVLKDDQTGLEQRIYYKDGQLRENYGLTGGRFAEDAETVIGSTDRFEMRMIGEDILEIQSGFGNSYVRIGF